MTDAAETPVELDMIRAAASAPMRLHRFETLIEDFTFSLGPVLTGFIGGDVTVDLTGITYPDGAEALAAAGETGEYMQVEAAPWHAPLLLWIERPVLRDFMNALLGLKTAEATDRPFTRLEQGIVKRIGRTVLDRFSGAMSPVRALDCQITGMEAPEWDAATPLRSRSAMHVTYGETTGDIALILPFAAFADDRDALALQIALPKQGGEARDEMTTILNGAGGGSHRRSGRRARASGHRARLAGGRCARFRDRSRKTARRVLRRPDTLSGRRGTARKRRRGATDHQRCGTGKVCTRWHSWLTRSFSFFSWRQSVTPSC